jgi:ABC-2 type transport system ATP-binding protein
MEHSGPESSERRIECRRMIQIDNLSKSFRDTRAIDSVTLEVRKNELFGLIGPDGAGKSTLMRILMTLLLPDSGRAEMNGLDVVKDYKAIRKQTGYMPGRFSLYQDLSVEENLRFFATVFGTTLEENYALIKDIYRPIEPFKKRLAGKLSGGMKQKLALSCALIHKPVILILDEPTTGVDAVSRKEFWEMLKNLQNKGITLLVSTPYMDEAGRCDRVALMQKGRIMEVNNPEAMVKKYQRKILAVHASDMYRLVTDLRSYEKTESAYAFGQFVHFTGINDQANPEEVKSFLRKKNHQQVEVKEITPGIEDVFMGLMKKDGNNGTKEIKQSPHSQNG